MPQDLKSPSVIFEIFLEIGFSKIWRRLKITAYLLRSDHSEIVENSGNFGGIKKRIWKEWRISTAPHDLESEKISRTRRDTRKSSS